MTNKETASPTPDDVVEADIAFIRAFAECAAANGPIQCKPETARDMLASLDRIVASLPKPDDKLVSLLDWFGKHTNLELSYDWEDEVWQVHQVNGGINDREWTKIGDGLTPAEAMLAAQTARIHQALKDTNHAD